MATCRNRRRRLSIRQLWFPAAVLAAIALAGMMGSAALGLEQKLVPGRFYRAVDGKVDERTYNGFRRYNAACNHCHGPDGVGSTFAPSLVDRLPDVDAFRRFALNGTINGTSGMRGFAGDPNIAPYVDDIYAYLQARNEGALSRGRPVNLGQ